MVNSKSRLAIELSKLKVFDSPNERLEQYPTESEFAAEILWFSSMKNEISEKVIVDLGCGTGILGIGALLLDAKKVIFVDIDDKALEIAKENVSLVDKSLINKCVFIKSDVKEFIFTDDKIDLVLQNPPFGTRRKHADVEFLVTAMEISSLFYSFHKLETRQFIDDYVNRKGFKITHDWNFDWPIKMALSHHKKKIQRIRVGCFRIEKAEEKKPE